MTADVTLLLGCGSVGLAVARLLGHDRAFRRVIVADRHLERASAAAELCNGKADSLTLDCTDDDTLNRVLEDVALVVNTVELPLDGLLPMIRSIVEAGVSYTDANGRPGVAASGVRFGIPGIADGISGSERDSRHGCVTRPDKRYDQLSGPAS